MASKEYSCIFVICEASYNKRCVILHKTTNKPVSASSKRQQSSAVHAEARGLESPNSWVSWGSPTAASMLTSITRVSWWLRLPERSSKRPQLTLGLWLPQRQKEASLLQLSMTI